jgi:hypothetical protein
VTVLHRLRGLRLHRDHRDGIRLLGHLLQDVGILHLRDDLDRLQGDLVLRLRRDEVLRLGVVPWGEECFRGWEMPDGFPFLALKQRGCFPGEVRQLDVFPYLGPSKTGCFRDAVHQQQALWLRVQQVPLELLELQGLPVLVCHLPVLEASGQP